jgi:hypothetical protein
MWNHAEVTRLLLAQRDRRTIELELERIAAERPTHKRELGAFDEAEHHQALDGGIGRLDGFDADAITGFEIGKCQTAAPALRRK